MGCSRLLLAAGNIECKKMFERLLASFKFYWTLYFVVLTIFVGCLICWVDNLNWRDAVFTASSALTGAGLATVPMGRLSRWSFVYTALLMVVGCPAFMLFPTLFYRRACFEKINKEMIQDFRKRTSPLPYQKLKIIKEYYLIYESLCLITYIVLLYLLLWLFFGILFVWITLQIQPLSIELQDRGFSYSDSAMYLALSAFGNCGMTMTSNSLMDMPDNPACYFILSIIILAGNTMFPIFLRYLIELLLYLDVKFDLFGSTKTKNRFSHKTPYNYSFSTRVVLTYILNNPREIITHLFTDHQTKVLCCMVFSLIFIQYFFFLISINRNLTRKYSLGRLIGIGYFQTMSTRTAGFSIMDLRDLNEGVAFVYFIMMYLAAYPFVTTMQTTKQPLVGSGIDLEDEIITESITQKKEQEKKVEEEFELRLKKDHSSVFLEQMNNLNHKIMKSTRKKLDLEENDHHDDYENHSLLSRSQHSVARRRGSHSSQGSAASFNQTVVNPLMKIESIDEENAKTEIDDKPGPVNLPEREADDKLEKQPSTLQDRPRLKTIDNDEEQERKVPADEEVGKDVKSQIGRKFLFRHTFFLVLAVLILSYSEDGLLRETSKSVNLWYITFELISAYGAVGLSFGIPGKAYSLSGELSTIGKIVLILSMWLGKHRGLPNKDDPVIDFKFEKFRKAYQQKPQNNKLISI
jgi:Trk-type K+ transport system membrane component